MPALRCEPAAPGVPPLPCDCEPGWDVALPGEGGVGQPCGRGVPPLLPPEFEPEADPGDPGPPAVPAACPDGSPAEPLLDGGKPELPGEDCDPDEDGKPVEGDCDPELPLEPEGALLELDDGSGGIELGIDVELVVLQPPAANAAASSQIVNPAGRCIAVDPRRRAAPMLSYLVGCAA